MIHLGKTLVSEDIIEKEFVCNISKCKGICCVEGESGAPLEENETLILDQIYDSVKPYMRLEGIQAIEEQGKHIIDHEGDYVTPLVNQKECAYVIFEENGTASCAIEKAYNDGKVDWKKPISCHLYPIRVTDYSEFSAVNYHRWPICDDACSLGKELQVPIYQFTKESLIRKFGEDWYNELSLVAQEYQKNLKK
ncbi:hypothetical protein UJ101_01651 [Flavobacteriaceae bacterium UJ101]|nr:hypothetical protein UJ101_01651 [Flavobacteriaceae bacterium UJ101]